METRHRCCRSRPRHRRPPVGLRRHFLGEHDRHPVVAAENFWGSIARQIAADQASVQSIIVDPAQDPHSYEPTANDARTLATAQLAIVNGVGYARWVWSR